MNPNIVGSSKKKGQNHQRINAINYANSLCTGSRTTLLQAHQSFKKQEEESASIPPFRLEEHLLLLVSYFLIAEGNSNDQGYGIRELEKFIRECKPWTIIRAFPKISSIIVSQIQYNMHSRRFSQNLRSKEIKPGYHIHHSRYSSSTHKDLNYSSSGVIGDGKPTFVDLRKERIKEKIKIRLREQLGVLLHSPLKPKKNGSSVVVQVKRPQYELVGKAICSTPIYQRKVFTHLERRPKTRRKIELPVRDKTIKEQFLRPWDMWEEEDD